MEAIEGPPHGFNVYARRDASYGARYDFGTRGPVEGAVGESQPLHLYRLLRSLVVNPNTPEP